MSLLLRLLPRLGVLAALGMAAGMPLAQTRSDLGRIEY